MTATIHSIHRDAESGDRLFCSTEAGRFLGVSKSWLDKSRLTGGGPRYCRIGRLVRYRRDALMAYALSREQGSTSEAA